jgi:hypothetical protein
MMTIMVPIRALLSGLISKNPGGATQLQEKGLPCLQRYGIGSFTLGLFGDQVRLTVKFVVNSAVFPLRLMVVSSKGKLYL